jgi:NADPH:quinone reductase-like Zn-dependent oxidoreductase
MSGHEVEVDLRLLMIKRLTLTASTLRARDADEKARLACAVETNVWPWLETGRMRPIIDRTFPLERAGEAHQWLEQGSQFGKVVLLTDV